MPEEMKVPDIGGFTDVAVIDVLVKAGDAVKKEDPLITLESDKAAMDVPAPFAGTVKELRVKVGDKVSEGDVILLTGPTGEAPAEVKSEKERGEGNAGEDRADKEEEGESKKEDKQDKPKDEKSAKQDQRVGMRKEGDRDKKREETESETQARASRKPAIAAPPTVEQARIVQAHAGPSVRKFARELSVDLSQVRGSGRKERITHEDVKRYVKAALLRGGAGTGLPRVSAVDFSGYGEVETRPLSRIKRISGPRLQAAWVNAPHVTQHDEADMTALETVRKALNADAANRGFKLTPLAFLVRAVVLAMKAYPDFNSALDAAGENLIVRHYYHIGFAVDTEQGLVVPVIRDADEKGLGAIAEELATLAEKARAGKLRRDEIEGGCFSITSLGGIGGTAFTPIVNAPEVAILGISRAEMKPKWNGHDFEPRLMLPLSLSYDHRVIDGAQAVRFTRHLAETIETLRGLVG